MKFRNLFLIGLLAFAPTAFACHTPDHAPMLPKSDMSTQVVAPASDHGFPAATHNSDFADHSKHEHGNHKHGNCKHAEHKAGMCTETECKECCKKCEKECKDACEKGTCDMSGKACTKKYGPEHDQHPTKEQAENNAHRDCHHGK